MSGLNLLDFLNQNYYMLVPALWVIGYALKQTPKVPDWSIVWILVLISVSAGSLAFGFSFEGLLNGIVAAGVAVLGHQMKKQTLEGAYSNKKK
ncbi:phage holin family protein [Cytobacillus firmus]|uniref:phage holin family protein n=1 Tax=Cytobacillus firmus TaxID=1399 RepID=UPI00384E5FBF